MASEVKASIVAESYSGLETVTSIARRHGIAPNQLFAWRRELKRRDVALPFAPPQPPSSRRLLIRMARVDVAPASRWRRKRRRLKGGAVELEIDPV